MKEERISELCKSLKVHGIEVGFFILVALMAYFFYGGIKLLALVEIGWVVGAKTSVLCCSWISY